MDVNPLILYAAVTVAVGLVAVTAICYKPSRKNAPLSNPNSSKSKSSSASTSKKKSKPVKKVKPDEVKVVEDTVIREIENIVDAVDAELLLSRKVNMVHDEAEEMEWSIVETEAEGPTEVEGEASSLKRMKKPKETQEQRVARLERQKNAKLLKKTPPDFAFHNMGVTPVAFKASSIKEINSEAPSSSALGNTHSPAVVCGSAQYGWAVVEDKKKSKLLTKFAPSGSSRNTPDLPGNLTIRSVSSSTSKSKAEAATVPVAEKASAVSAAATAPVPAPSTNPTPMLQTPEPLAADVVKLEVLIDPKKVGAVIGPKGAILRALQEAAGAEITLSRDRDSNATSVAVSLSGSADGVAKLAKAITDLSTKGFTSLLEGEDFSEGHVSVHPMFVPDIIGKGGSVRKAIEAHTGVRVVIPSGVTRDQASNAKIGLAGPKEKVAEAKKIIKEITRYFHSPVTHPGLVHEELELPSSNYNIIIGRGGSEIRHIQGNFKVSVHIPNEDSVAEHVVVVGEPAGVEAAHRYILKLIDQVLSSKDRKKTDNEAVDKHDDDEEEAHEEWMDEFTHPSKRKSSKNNNSSAGAFASSGSYLLDAFPALAPASLTATPTGASWGTASQHLSAISPSQAPTSASVPLDTDTPGLGVASTAAIPTAAAAIKGSWAAAVMDSKVAVQGFADSTDQQSGW